jgi:hypothetical protein
MSDAVPHGTSSEDGDALKIRGHWIGTGDAIRGTAECRSDAADEKEKFFFAATVIIQARRAFRRNEIPLLSKGVHRVLPLLRAKEGLWGSNRILHR